MRLPSKQAKTNPLLQWWIKLNWEYSWVSACCIDYFKSFIKLNAINVRFQVIKRLNKCTKFCIPNSKLASTIATKYALVLLNEF